MPPAMPSPADRAPAPRRQRSSILLAGALVLLATGPLAAQGPAKSPTVTTFTSPDGTRFALVVDRTMRQVHWAVATPADPADEPPGIEGLAVAVAQASLAGTWRTGSLDPARERPALEALDQAFHAMLASPRDPAMAKRVAECEVLAASLGDPLVFPRVLAAQPAHRPEIVPQEGTVVLQFSTVAPAIESVAKLLLERREEQALRDLGKSWMRELVVRQNRYDADPASAVHAELLALAMPNHPASRAAERAGRGMPRRDQALAVWQATQRPERTVHALVGDFDPAVAQRTLCAVFTSTALPPASSPQNAPLRPIQSVRRSTVPGVREPMVAIAWVMPEPLDTYLLDAAVRWFGGGRDSWLGRALAKAGRSAATVACRAPWPVVVGGQSLFLVDVSDSSGAPGLAEFVVQQARLAAAQAPTTAELQSVATAQHLAWNLTTADPRRVAADIAGRWLLRPQAVPPLGPPQQPDGRAVQQVLAKVLASQPVVVEGRR
jgi:predicted Zn-dependent peptidase